MLKKLSEMKLVDYVPYQGARLTASGEKIALEVIRHHRLIEVYLMEAMGYSWDQVHAEADKLEHAISEEFEDRIAQLLGNPTTDPHGDPIPTKSGQVAPISHDTLLHTEVGQTVAVQRVRDEDPAVLRNAAELGLWPRTVLLVDSKTEAGLTVVMTDGSTRYVSSGVAGSIFILQSE
jgi:DtxR family transcriptional regulator, Mn-dependent transcriptional regulator